MAKLWSEVPLRRSREIGADLLTLFWVVSWSALGWHLYGWLARLGRAGEVLQSAGEGLDVAGQEVGAAVGRVPMIGARAGALIEALFAATAQPFRAAGQDLQRLLLGIAMLLVILIVGVPVSLWLIRYIPWRLQGLISLGAAHRVIRLAPDLPEPEIQRILGSRALHRLSYETLLAYTPDPFGDWSAGRYEGLARAELESVGLRPRMPRRQTARRRERWAGRLPRSTPSASIRP